MSKAHDRKVRQRANELKKAGWSVKADLPGYEIPKGIGQNNYIPDILATKGNKKLIVEVDTPGTVNPEQLSAFRRSAGQSDNSKFEHIITKPRKK